MRIAILLLLTSVLVAAPKQKEQRQDSYPNPSSTINLKKQWTGITRASFIYWHAQEDGLSLAQSANLVLGNLVMPLQAEELEQDFSYKPGFQFGLGAVYDNEWTLDGNYIWLWSKTTTSQSAPQHTAGTGGLGVWSVGNWFQQTIADSHLVTPQSQSLSGTHIESTWNLWFNVADVKAGRSWYQTKQVTLNPSLGLRAAWIYQKMDVALTQAGASVGGDQNLGPQPIHSLTHSSSFGVGPRVACEMNYLLPSDWRFTGRGSASFLATWFTDLTHSEDAQSIGVTPGPYQLNGGTQFDVLPNADIGLGVGWQTKLRKGACLVDVSVCYDFVYFWGQNEMRAMLDRFWSGMGVPAGDLSFHGVTATAGFYY